MGTILCSAPLQAATYEVLQEFRVPGAQPMSALVQAGDGDFYGTTVAGGASGRGTVFRLTAGGGQIQLVSFAGNSGAFRGGAPVAGLTPGPDGALYGTTTEGGSSGFGTIFRIGSGGAFSTLVDFTGSSGLARGSVPSQLASHPDGNLYGTTQGGGTGGLGTVFRVTTAGGLTTLVDFTGTGGVAAGAAPRGPLAVQGSTLFGVSGSGGAGDFGTIFKITTSGAFTLMASFTGTAGTTQGAVPGGGLHLHSDGKLYGTTRSGGTSDQGTFFKITTAAAPVFTLLRSFADATGSLPGGTLARDGMGALYGTTSGGGVHGLGTCYKITSAGVHTVLGSFTGSSGTLPGAAPEDGLVLGNDGLLYGTASAGGTGNRGAVFQLTTAGEFTALTDFGDASGWHPGGAPVADGSGGYLFPLVSGGSGGAGLLVSLATGGSISPAAVLGNAAGDNPVGSLLKVGSDFYGVTERGGASGRGAAFRYRPATGPVKVSDFTSLSGGLSEGPFIAGTDGALYGVSREGGTGNRGTIYKLTTAGVRTRLVSFTGTTGAAKGQRPRGPLALGPDGNFYGVTERGGTADAGTLFRMNASGTLTVLAEFAANGPRLPLGGLITGGDGKLYGTTSAGGSADAGTFFQINPGSGTWVSLAEFTGSSGPAAGSRPVGPLAGGEAGVFYGLTAAGGAANHGGCFRYDAAAGLQTLVEFTGSGGSAPGVGLADLGAGNFAVGGVVAAGPDLLYGVTPAGGAGGGGVAFRLTLGTPPSPFSQWRQTFAGDAAAPLLADPDADGLPLLMEYALGLLPTVNDTASMPAAALYSYASDDVRLRLILTRDPARSDVTLTVQAASYPEGPWEPLATSVMGAPFSGAGYVSGDAATPGLKTIEIRDTVTSANAPRRFLRVKATL